jgi:glycerol-3-phosphate O-acyltransferase
LSKCAILAWHRQQKALREIGPDPKAYRQKLKAELLADPEFRREYGETLRSQATTRPSSVTSLPNLARAPGSAGRSASDEWPTTDAEIFADVTRRRA